MLQQIMTELDQWKKCNKMILDGLNKLENNNKNEWLIQLE